MTRRMLGILVGAAVLVPTGATWAHEEISPSSITTGKPAFLILSAANERKADLVKVALAAPAGASFGGSTREPPGWSVTRTDDLVTWNAGTVKPDRFEQWGFEIEGPDQPGSLAYRVTLGYADGTSEDATADVTATAAGAGPSGATSGTGTTSGAGAALGTGLVALVLSLAALAVSLRRRPDSIGGPQAGDQDW